MRPKRSNRGPQPRSWRRALALLIPAFGLSLATLAVGQDATSAARSRRPATIDIADIKPGMRGHAITVFHGTKSDRFEIEVIDVKRDYQTGQDAVFFRSSDPRLLHSGIVGGMSGSPIYIEGKLAGALAYGYRFNKDPIGGMTPIAKMLEVDALPYRPGIMPHPKVRGVERAGTQAWADQMLGLGASPLPPRMRPDDIPDARGITAAGLEQLEAPVSVGGLSRQAADYLGAALSMHVVRGSGGGGRDLLKKRVTRKKWRPGDSVSVVLIAGDNASGANGTVTWVGGRHGERLLAFGHPMRETGPSRLPIADARVHVIIPSVQRSVKLSSALSIQGTMIQDRQPAIALRTNIESPMIPVVTTVQGPDPLLPARRYQSAVADNTSMTAPLATSLLISAISEAASDAVELTLITKHTIELRTGTGPRTYEIEEETFFPQGVIGGVVARSRAITLLNAATDNRFEIAEIRRIEQSATLEYGIPNETLTKIRMVSNEVRAGELVEIDAFLENPRGHLRTQRVSLRIPKDMGNRTIVIQLAGGEWVRPYRPLPHSVDSLLDNIVASYPARSIIASIYTGDEGIATRQGLLSDLPPSVFEGLSVRGSTEGVVRFKQTSRRVIHSRSIIDGQQRFEIEVLPARSL